MVEFVPMSSENENTFIEFTSIANEVSLFELVGKFNYNFAITFQYLHFLDFKSVQASG
jgi:hypothetical protein